MKLSHDLPRLATAGTRIINTATSEPVLLRGLNRSGMEYSDPDEDGFCSAAGISRHEIRHLCREWNANILRIPFNQDWALRGRGERNAEEYLADIDRIIDWDATYGAYTLLDLQWLDADQPFGSLKNGDRNFVPPLPDWKSAELWRVLAERYRDEPAVLFDIFNEPHDRLENDTRPMFRPDGSVYPATEQRVTINEWRPWALLLIDTIREVHPEALVFVSGLNWGYDLRGFPLDRANLVYSTHVYPNKGSNWREAFGDLARIAPVFAGEFGGVEKDLDWGRRLLAYFNELAIGWCAWSWSDWPHMMTRYQPTPFGEIVKGALDS
jgi:hypothetical protein